MPGKKRNLIVVSVCFGCALLLIVAMSIVSESVGFAGIGRQIFFLSALTAIVAVEVSGLIALGKMRTSRRKRDRASEKSQSL